MDAWDIVREVYVTQLDNAEQAPAAQGMIDLLDHLRTLPDFEGVEAGLTGMALALALPDCKRRAYAAWVEPWTYAVFLDFCEPAFYGERVTIPIEDVVTTLREYLDRVRDSG